MQVLKFSTPSCGQCKVVDASLQKAGIEYEEIDCTSDDPRCEQYHIQHVPTVIVLYDDGSQKILNGIGDVKQWLAHQR